MPTRIAFDNNVIDAMLLEENQARMQPILACVAAGLIEFYATQQLITESLRIIESPKRAWRLQDFGGVIGHLTDGRHLRTAEAVMMTELLGNADPVGPPEDRRLLRGLLGNIATGSPNLDNVRAITQDARAKQETATTRWKELQGSFRIHVKGLSPEDKKKILNVTFDEVQRRNWELWGRNFIERFAGDYSVPEPARVAGQVMLYPERFPYVRRYLRVFALLQWWWRGQNRRVHEGDHNDALQLFGIPAVDHFVTGTTRYQPGPRFSGIPPGV